MDSFANTMSFFARTDVDNFLRNLKARRFKLSISRNATTNFKEVGLIAIDSVTIADLRTENKVQGGTLQGYEFAMTFTVPNMSVFADNQYVVDREDISAGRWYVSLTDIETRWVRVTPFPVSLDLVEADFGGTQYTFKLRTSDLEWLKHKSPTAPVVINPLILPQPNIFPASFAESNPMTFTFQLSNPSISQSIENNVVYDILIYADAARTVFLASALNKTKAEIIDVAMPQSQILDSSDNPFVFERGRVYYCIARCKLANEYADTLFEFATQLSAPTLSGFPSSVEVPTNTFFQGTSSRGTANINATQAEFEWEVGTTPQSNVNVFYNTIGNATGIFNLPTISSPTQIKVRARSKNAAVIGEWSDYVFIDVTLFRPTPIFTLFSASTNKVALQAEPTEVVRFTVIGSYPADVFGGALSINILRLDTLTSIGSMVIPSVNTSSATPFTLTADFAIGDTVASQAPIQFVARVTRPDLQTFDSIPQTVDFISRPSLAKVTVMFNPNQKVYKDISTMTLCQAGDAVQMWESRSGMILPTRRLEQNVVTSRPTYKLLPSTSTLPTQRFMISSIGGRKLEGIPTQSYLPALNAPERNRISMIVVGFIGIGIGGLVSALVSSPFYRLSFAAGGGDGWEFTQPAATPFITYSAFNALRIFAMTFERNTTAGSKLYDSLQANSTVPVATRDTADVDFANGNAAPHLNEVVSTTVGAIREVGHIIIFEDTVLSGSELQEWFDWLKAIYKL